jgi:alpha-beta hydrolase superfamily lysophospholipase
MDRPEDRPVSMPASGYSEFDIPEILDFLFHPRPDYGGKIPEGAEDFSICTDTDPEIHVAARLFSAGGKLPFILFFHGNGEIVSDYDDLGPLYSRLGLNFMAVDYRGYGKSSGNPSVRSMMNDSLAVFDFTVSLMKERGFTGPLAVMGRSLGSASACEIAMHNQEKIGCLIIESGFSRAVPLLRRLGARTSAMDTKNSIFDNSFKLSGFRKPVLIIHAEHDHIIPFSDALELMASLPEYTDKKLLKIRDADHNSIFYNGMNEYLEAVLGITMK